MLRALIASAFLVLVAGERLTAQEQYWVDGNNCPGPGNGSFADPFCTIAQGIAAAASGDYVRVMPGTYTGLGNVNLDFGGKNIHLRGELPEVVIDGQNANRILHLHSGETSEAEVFRLTLRNGRAPMGENGGAVLIEGSSPTFYGCTIELSEALNGGAMYIDGLASGSSPNLTFISFLDNTALDRGGGLHVVGASPEMLYCWFLWNHANNGGGGAFVRSAAVSMNTCWFGENTALDGAGLNCESGNVQIEGGFFSRNTASQSGGGVYLETDGNATLRHITFTWNEAQLAGGGLYTANGDPTITNCLFALNETMAGHGGGIHINSGNPALTNCTVADNSAAFLGGGVYHQNSIATIVNTIIWRNAPQQISLAGTGTPTISYSDIQGGWFGTGNLNADPRFGTGPVHGYYLRQLASGHADESPCVDAGISNAESTPLLSRTTRRDQVADAYPVDIGFHEQIIPSAYRPGDFTRDGKVDLADFRFFQQCYTGSGVETPPSSCWFFDHDSDFDVDDVDFADWVQWLTGP